MGKNMNKKEFLLLFDEYVEIIIQDLRYNIENKENKEILMKKFFFPIMNKVPEEMKKDDFLEKILRFYTLLAVLDISGRMIQKIGQTLIKKFDNENTKDLAEFARTILNTCTHE
jgi:hypothetical protein